MTWETSIEVVHMTEAHLIAPQDQALKPLQRVQATLPVLGKKSPRVPLGEVTEVSWGTPWKKREQIKKKWEKSWNMSGRIGEDH